MMVVMYKLAHNIMPEHADKVIAYMERLPKDFCVPFVKAAIKRHKSLVSTPSFAKWCMENAALVAALN